MLKTLRFLIYLTMLTVVALLAITLWARTAPRPGNLGLHNGSLVPCPDTRACISSQNRTQRNWLAPLRYSTTREAARQQLLAIIRLTPRTHIVSEAPDYIAVEYRSWGFEFVDDVEFYFDPGEPIIHFRSASRLGYWDFGWNHQRIESIRHAFEELQNRGVTDTPRSAQ